jgi:hypothetical protein
MELNRRNWILELARRFMPWRLWDVLFQEDYHRRQLEWRIKRLEQSAQGLFGRLLWVESLLGHEIADPLDERFASHEIRVFSQSGEDGILLHIFCKIGVTDARVVEFGVEDGVECNAANLITDVTRHPRKFNELRFFQLFQLVDLATG